jgi:hypothetical protein
VVVVLGLFAAYRSLGAPSRTVDSTLLLTALHGQLRGSIAALAKRLEADDPSGEPASDAARDGRKVSAAVQQTLDRLPPADSYDARDAAVRVVLAAAAEDTAWAWRMIEAQAVSPAIVAAATTLAGHAAECCDEAEALLVAAPSSEPGEGA